MLDQKNHQGHVPQNPRTKRDEDLMSRTELSFLNTVSIVAESFDCTIDSIDVEKREIRLTCGSSQLPPAKAGGL